MPYQKPRADHPWKTNKSFMEDTKKIKPVKTFLVEIIESWEKVDIITNAYGREGRFNLNELSEKKKAAWLAGVLRRNYG